jgi:flagellar motility protein MotE (MotC chaperone)
MSRPSGNATGRRRRHVTGTRLTTRWRPNARIEDELADARLELARRQRGTSEQLTNKAKEKVARLEEKLKAL